MIRYVFKDDDMVILRNAKKADPQKIGEALAKISEAEKGYLTPEAVIVAAKSPRHVLHPHFEWDDEAAAHAHRLGQARRLISLIRIEDEATSDIVPAFHSIADRSGKSYRTAEAVTNSRELQLIVLRQAERELKAFERRYRVLQDVCVHVRAAQEAVGRKLAEHETRTAA